MWNSVLADQDGLTIGDNAEESERTDICFDWIESLNWPAYIDKIWISYNCYPEIFGALEFRFGIYWNFDIIKYEN